MTLTEFLLSRIAEDEAVAHIDTGGDLIPADCWGPDRVLAECEVKRRILERHQAQLDRQGDPEESQLSADICVAEYEEWIIPALALPYVDHPDYQQEWRP